MPINSTFQVVGASGGAFVWSTSQDLSFAQQVNCESSHTISIDNLSAGSEELINESPGSSVARLFDAPGQSLNTSFGKVMSLERTWNFTLRPTVRVGGRIVSCPVIRWRATSSYKTINGELQVEGRLSLLP